MKTRVLIASGIFLAALVNMIASVPAQAKTEKECADEWNQLKAANKTADKKRADFIKECRASSPSTTTTTTTTKPPATNTETTKPPVVTGNIVFPSAISPKYASESPGKGRMHTCRDQYEANKPTNKNGGLKWIEKEGGYYSECNKHLKG